MEWKFWKKSDGSDADLSSFSSGSGFGAGFGTEGRHGELSGPNTGLDLTQHFDAPQASAFDAGSATASLPPLGPPGASTDFGQANSALGAAGGMQPSAFGQYNAATPAQANHDASDEARSHKEFEILAAKLDTIRAQMETVNVRLAALEERLSASQGPQPARSADAQARRPWY
jgi:hypothetical protein